MNDKALESDIQEPVANNSATKQITLDPRIQNIGKIVGQAYKNLAIFTNEHRAVIDSINRSLQGIRPIIREAIAGIQREWAQLHETILRAQEARLEAYPNLIDRVETLTRKGWFVSLFFELDVFDRFATASENIDGSTLETMLSNAYKTSIEEHTTAILREFPERSLVIRSALNAHLRGEFALSVPVFFAQADGIAGETVGKYIFSGNKEKGTHISCVATDEIQKHSEGDTCQVFHLLYLALWQPLIDAPPIAYNPSRRKSENYNGLNRHMVLHGESLDYATEENSLKAFSLLSYIASLLPERRIENQA